MSFVIMVDSNSEVPLSWIKEYDLELLKMPYQIDGMEYEYDLGENTDIEDFYQRMRNGATPTTNLITADQFIERWAPLLDAGRDILYIGFSSALSATYENSVMACSRVKETYALRKVICVDSLAISLPTALLIRHTVNMRAQGRPIEETAQWVEENKQRANAFFTVDDLNYLKRGGRLSGAAAFFGSILEIKPVLYINEEGKLVPIDKVKGRRKALKYLADQVVRKAIDLPHATVCIPHASCLGDAKTLEGMIRAQSEVGEVIFNDVGPVIGSHAGPGTVAVCFMGTDRKPAL